MKADKADQAAPAGCATASSRRRLGLETNRGDAAFFRFAARQLPSGHRTGLQAEQAAADGRQHGNEAIARQRIGGIAKRQRLPVLRVQVLEFDLRVHGDDVVRNLTRTQDIGIVQKVRQPWLGMAAEQLCEAGKIKLGERALAVNGDMHEALQSNATPRNPEEPLPRGQVPDGRWFALERRRADRRA